MEVVRELVILRHAQAGGCEMGQHDVDRCLTPLGRNQPLKVANKLSAAGFAPQPPMLRCVLKTGFMNAPLAVC